MGRIVDGDVLRGFVEEARGYLPLIVEDITSLAADPTRGEALEEAHRHTHTIKGTASLLGLSGLSHAAYQIEEVLDGFGLGRITMTAEDRDLLLGCVGDLATYLDDVAAGKPEEPALAERVARICLQLRGAGGAPLDRPAPDSTLEAELSGHATTRSESEAGLPSAPAEREGAPPELMEVFNLEAEDHLRDMNSQLAALAKDPASRETLEALRRTVHTLKGAAGAVGSRQIAELTHRMEDLLDRLYEGSLAIESRRLDLLFDSVDILGEIAQGKTRRASDKDRLTEIYGAYSSALEAPRIPSARERGEGRPLVPVPEPEPLEVPLPSAGVAEPEAAEPMPSGQARKSGEVVRVQLDRLDDLVRLVSELVITRTALEQRMIGFEHEVEELQLSTERLRRVAASIETKYEVTALGGRSRLQDLRMNVGGITGSAPSFSREFDELELDRYTEFHLLSRELIETVNDIRTIGSGLSALAGEFDSGLSRQGQVSSEIQDKLMRTRMVPLTTLSARLHRAVRLVAREQGKLVDLVLEGDSIELDKTVLEEMEDPLVHLLRNAVDHGVELPAARKRAGKPERGEIRLRAFQEGNRVVIQVGDDGAGMDIGALRAAAVRGGFVPEAEGDRWSAEELQSLTFLPGFTTAAEVSQVSGRGVGLDIVRTNIRKLKGSISVESTPGRGTLFTIRLPMTLAVMRALMVMACNQTFAVPHGAVSAIVRVDRSEINHVGSAAVIQLDEQAYPLIRLAEALSLKRLEEAEEARFPVLILDVGAQKVALAVDQLLGEREVVVKSLGNHLRRVEGVAGATLMGDGSVVLILNPIELLGEKSGKRPEIPGSQPRPAPAGETLTVMVVDDSITVRRVVSNLIRSAGWTPVAARDGLEALEIIQRGPALPDAVLVDIEMPRMDGYELMSTLRAHPTYARIPLLVLTSRTGEKHRQKALSVGASGYIVKPYQDALLLDTIRDSARSFRETVAA